MKTVEIGHIFKLGYKYSESMGLHVLQADGKEVPVIMGSYGIGIERILSAAIELYHDDDGMALPASIAPFEVVVTPVNSSEAGAAARRRRNLQTALRWALMRCWTIATSARRQVQGRRPDRYSVPHHGRQETGAGHGGAGGAPRQEVG